jgi:hypothetical protein
VAWCGRASLSRANALVDRIDRKAKSPLVRLRKRTNEQDNNRRVAALPEGSVLSLRTHPCNPNHHLWWNNGTWWLHATVHRPDYTKQRLRLPLETKNIHRARTTRDTLLASLCGDRKEAA